jgi:hypothetical protein
MVKRFIIEALPDREVEIGIIQRVFKEFASEKSPNSKKDTIGNSTVAISCFFSGSLIRIHYYGKKEENALVVLKSMEEGMRLSRYPEHFRSADILAKEISVPAETPDLISAMLSTHVVKAAADVWRLTTKGIPVAAVAASKVTISASGLKTFKQNEYLAAYVLQYIDLQLKKNAEATDELRKDNEALFDWRYEALIQKD